MDGSEETAPWVDAVNDVPTDDAPQIIVPPEELRAEELQDDGGPEFTDVMVDIETGGLYPDRAPIIQIGAVKFNLKKKTFDHNVFKASLTVPPHRFWDQKTTAWWNTQKRSVLTEIVGAAQPYRDVIHAFAEWSYQNPGLRFWSKPTHFDFVFLASYFADEDLPNPFHFRVARDLNSYLEALFYPNPVPDEITKMPMEADAHDALNDVWHQLSMLFKAIDLAKGV